VNQFAYRIVIDPLSNEGGFFATIPDLPGCMSGGETSEQPAANVQDAIAAWIEAALELEVRQPNRLCGQP
jgi:antitoxin HicB